MVKKNSKSEISQKEDVNPRLSASLAGELPRLAQSAPPVVAVLGHVDHGKTTLLDAIRKTDIAKKEYGGITQGIGASSIEFIAEGKKRKITFIDTPGHEAFSLMRGRGAIASDIGLLVVSSIDGVMPQTKESIKVLKDAKIPYIVVLTKIDLPEKNEDKVISQLLKEGVMLEGYGGSVPYIGVSSVKNVNIKELLELILLVYEMGSNKAKFDMGDFKGIVVESKLDQRVGPKATIVIKKGSLSIRDVIGYDNQSLRVRTIINDKGEHLTTASIGDAVEILGFDKVPPIGKIVAKKDVQAASFQPQSTQLQEGTSNKNLSVNITDFLAPKDEPKLSIILVANNLGSLEAISKSVPKEIKIVLQKTGDISPADILHAKSMNAIVLGFNTKIKPQILKFANQEKVLVKNYRIIYELLDELNDVLEGKEIAKVEEVYGRAKVMAQFPFEKTKVLGIKVLEGRVARGDKVRLIRPKDKEDIIIGESTIASVRIGKNPTSKVEEGKEAGILITPFLDFTIGDMIIWHG